MHIAWMKIKQGGTTITLLLEKENTRTVCSEFTDIYKPGIYKEV